MVANNNWVSYFGSTHGIEVTTEYRLIFRNSGFKGSFTYYVISRGGEGVSKCLRLITGGGGGFGR